MSKIRTIIPDYTGCDPEIVEALLKGLWVECLVSDSRL